MSDLFGSTPPAQQGYVSSPQQEKLFEVIMPLMQEWANKGFKDVGPQPYVSPEMPQIPGIEGMMPTKGWYEGIEPGIKEAVWQPYMEGADVLKEQLGGIGALGNQRAGMSGAAADVFSDYFQDSSSKVTKSLWDMTAPGAMAGWQGEMGLVDKALQGGIQGGLAEQGQAYASQIDPYALLMGGMPTAIPDTYFAPEGRDPGLIGSLFK